LDTEALISPDIEEPMIGAEWMKAHRCLWDFRGSELYIDGRAAVMLTQRKKLWCRRLYVDQEVVVPARHQATVPARSTLLSTKWLTGDTIVETRQMQPGVYLGRTLLPPGHRDPSVNIVNTTAEPKTVAVGEWLGNLHDFEVPSDQEWSETSSDQQPSGIVPMSTEPVDVRAAAASSTGTEIVDSLLQQLPDSLDAEQRQQVGQLLQNYQDIFSKALMIWDVLTWSSTR